MDAAERKYQEADLESKLKQLEDAKQRQVITIRQIGISRKCNAYLHFTILIKFLVGQKSSPQK